MVGLCITEALLNYADRVNMSVCIMPLGNALGYGIGGRATSLSAFFWGCVPALLLVALAARRIGTKAVLALGTVGWSLFTAHTPLAAVHAAGGAGDWTQRGLGGGVSGVRCRWSAVGRGLVIFHKRRSAVGRGGERGTCHHCLGRWCQDVVKRKSFLAW